MAPPPAASLGFSCMGDIKAFELGSTGFLELPQSLPAVDGDLLDGGLLAALDGLPDGTPTELQVFSSNPFLAEPLPDLPVQLLPSGVMPQPLPQPIGVPPQPPQRMAGPAWEPQQHALPPFSLSDASQESAVSHRGPQKRQRKASPVRRHSSSDADDPTMVAQREKVKETNRKAQRRYRDRQREKLAEAEARVAELSQQLQQLQVEKDAIATSHEMLKRCNAMRKAQSDSGAASIMQSDSDAWWVDDKTRAEIAELGSDDEVTFTVWPSAQMHLTRQQIMDMPLGEAASLWRAYLAAFTQLLSRMAGDPGSAAGRRLARLFHEALQLWGTLMCSRPERTTAVMRHLLADAEERDSIHAMDHDAEDRRLAAAAAFTPGQRAALCALRERLLLNLGRLQRRREALTARLQDALPRADSPRSSMDSNEASSSQASAGSRRSAAAGDDRYGAALAAMAALRESLRQEHCCYLQGVFLFWRRLLIPSQGAQLTVLAFPHDLRVFGVADCVAIDAGQPPAAEILARGAAEPDLPLLALEDALPPAAHPDAVPSPEYGMAAA